MSEHRKSAGAKVTTPPPCGMIALRGTFADDSFQAALAECDLPIPDARRIATAPDGARRVGWMSPDELLVLCPAAERAELCARLETALAGQHALVADVSAMRARFALTGPAARVALAKLCPVDLARFGIGDLRRTRMAQVAAAFWMTGEDAFEIVCFRSVADYVEPLLTGAARHTGGLVLP